MFVGLDTPSRIVGEIKTGQIICVEAFPKEKIDWVNESVSHIFGKKPEINSSRIDTDLKDDIRYSWHADNLGTCIESIVSSLKPENINWGGSAEFFKGIISEITAESLDTPELPFYQFVLRIKFPGTGLDASKDVAKQLRWIRNTMRAYIDQMGGLSGKGLGMRPVLPAITILSIKTNQADINRIQTEVRRLKGQNIPPSEMRAIGDRVRKMEPYCLSQIADFGPRSHFLLAPNISIILGNTDHIGRFDIRTPYVLLLSPDDGLLDLDFIKMPLIPYSFASAWLLGDISNILITPLSIHAWCGAFWSELRDVRRAITNLSLAIVNKSAPTDEELDELTNLGLKAASLDIGIGLLEWGSGQAIEQWRNGDYPEPIEIQIPEGKSFGVIMPRSKSSGGPLSAIASDIAEGLSSMSRTISGVERQIELLSKRANESSARKYARSNDSYSRAIVDLTIILIILTLIVAINQFEGVSNINRLSVYLIIIFLSSAILFWKSLPSNLANYLVDSAFALGFAIILMILLIPVVGAVVTLIITELIILISLIIHTIFRGNYNIIGFFGERSSR